ncbi:beta and beta-prime subunits of DNA dependent RNA-polymerase [Basidiobolus meristosporus CBS 931.73]|uniref:DNA-directed RNA polymerase n=1 Tax=Basidiobolus meristosporus CBS 931.73 TaxID=1314790 RepID=A0A1Y1YF80_9FUNG|nr:beta and beta-prime subunits of DNA dependent RNA-polymerase [Basidiobolus meristosporus CBS 931.73]|eukprot:ORX96701.1 beta and beta-prime subunits of DNA dependent RNA-polymerase [Basidiobolus meristosporus CBS 931.73]
MCSSCGINVTNHDETKCPQCKAKLFCSYSVTRDGLVLRKPTSKSSQESGIKISLDKICSALEKNSKLYDKSNITNYIIKYILIPPIQTCSPEDPEYMSDLSTKYTQLVNYAKKGEVHNIYHAYSKIVGTKRTEGMAKFLSGKNGIFRDIMLGKRTERSACSVITGDPCLDYNTIYIPKYISDNIRIPICIHKHNLKSFSNHKIIFISNNKVPIDNPNLIFVNQTYEKLLLDDDKVLINRQPSLTKTSVLGFKAKI